MSDREVCRHCGENRSDTEHPAYTFYNCGFNGVERSWQCRAREAERTIADLTAKLQAAQGAVEKLQRFKDWVHNYLDSKGVPHHPPGNHGEHGCRIGDRMDWVWAEIEKDKSRLAAIEDALTGTNSDKIECSIVWDILHPTPPAGEHGKQPQLFRTK